MKLVVTTYSSASWRTWSVEPVELSVKEIERRIDRVHKLSYGII